MTLMCAKAQLTPCYALNRQILELRHVLNNPIPTDEFGIRILPIIPTDEPKHRQFGLLLGRFKRGSDLK